MLTKTGAPARLLRHVIAHGFPVFSFATFAELESRLWRPKFDRYLSMEYRRRLLHDINAVANWVDIRPEIASQIYCRDVDDDKFIHTALSANAGLAGDRRSGFAGCAAGSGLADSVARRSFAVT